MSEFSGIEQQDGPLEAVPDEFTMLRRYWEGVLNDPSVPPQEMPYLHRKAIEALDDLAGTRGHEVMFWGRAFRIQENEEVGGVICAPVFIDDRYWGRSIATNIVKIDPEQGGNDRFTVYHQIYFYRKTQDGMEARAFLLDYDRGNFKFFQPVVPWVEDCFPQSQPVAAKQLKRQIGELTLFAESIANYIGAGGLEAASPAAQMRLLDKKARHAETTSGALHQGILLGADNAYTLSLNDGRLKFKHVDISREILPANCMGITSFEAIALELQGNVGLPIDEGLCMALDLERVVADVEPWETVYVPLAGNNVDYVLQSNQQTVRSVTL